MSNLLETVKNLDRKIPVDTGAPIIEVPDEVITYKTSWDAKKYPSAPALDTKFGKENFSAELNELNAVWKILEEGEKFVAMLYTFRSTSGALKDVQVTANTKKEQKTEIYTTEFKILRPEIKKLFNLMMFHERAVKMFKSLIQSLVVPENKKEVHSQLKLDVIIKLLDLLIKMDKLKDMKSNLVNDFARYKRVVALIGGDLPDQKEIKEEELKLRTFLNNPAQPKGIIIFNAKKSLDDVSQSDDVLCMLIQHCREAIQNSRFLKPDDKFQWYRAIVYLMYILDGDESTGINAFNHRKTEFGEVLKLFKQTPVIPLFGDMQIEIKYDLGRCSHWTEKMKAQIDDTTRNVKAYYSLVTHHQRIREQYSAYISQFSSFLAHVRAEKAKPNAKENIGVDDCKKAFVIARKGLALVSSWNSLIRLQSVYKSAHPLDEKEYKRLGGQGKKGHEYEKVVRYAYSKKDLSVLVDVIGMIKGLGSLLQRSETVFIDLCWKYIHDQMQKFAHIMVSRPLRKAYKAKRKKVLDIMLTLRKICSDIKPGHDPVDDYKMIKAKILEKKYEYPSRFTPPSVDQVVLMRRMMDFIANDRADGMQGGMFKTKDLKPEWQAEWKSIYDEAYFFEHILNFKSSLRDSMDLSYLWYREFYLNMTKQPQFPIDMSLPWILTKFVIKGVQMKENMFYPMQIYNDAAEVALDFLDQRYLYDEIEAEVNLAFDQMLYHLSDEIFKYFKNLAGAMLIDYTVAEAYQRVTKGLLKVPVSRYSTLMSQSTLHLLGRVVNLQVLLSQHVLNNFKKNIRGIVCKFIANPLCNAVETKSFLDNARLAHHLASQHLPLDPFDSMLKAEDSRVSLEQGCGKMAFQVANELETEILPNWTYCSATRRFVASVRNYHPKDEDDEQEKKKLHKKASKHPKTTWYGNYYRPNSDFQSGFKKYIGAEHIHALLDILDLADLPYILRGVEAFIEASMGTQVMPAMKKIQTVLEKAPIGLPKSHFGPALAYRSLKDNNIIKALSGWKHLWVFFQSIREIGNGFAFIHLLESVMRERNDTAFSQAAFFSGVKPNKVVSPGEAQPLTAFQVDAKSPTPFYSVMSKSSATIGSTEAVAYHVKTNIENAERFLKGSLYSSTSFFSGTMRRLSETLEKLRASFDGAPPQNGVLDTHRGSDFARVFSVAQFAFCVSPKEDAKGRDSKDQFERHAILGDGFSWGGCILVHLLGYAARFEMMDMCYHILNVEEMNSLPDLTADQMRRLPKSAGAFNTQSLCTDAWKQFMENAKHCRRINDFVFSTIKSYCFVNQIKTLTG